MIYHLLLPLASDYSVFNVIRYITFRGVLAALAALTISFVFGPRLLARLKAGQMRQPISEYVPEGHASKKGTPTMGGVLILASLLASVLLVADLSNRYVLMTTAVILGYGILGGIDDWLKVSRGKNAGLSIRTKLLWQVAIAVAVVAVLLGAGSFDTTLSVPFFKNVRPDLGWLYLPFAVLVIVGTSNAVNLTDGLDGLAIGPVMSTAATYAILAYCAGHAKIASYLLITPVAGAGELAIVCAAMATASLGFLWFNAYPAQMFMGDVGALSLGGGLGVVAVVSKNELVLMLAGGVFVLEAMSVILQLGSLRLRNKQIFRMAPIHHHYELKGWPEPLIIVRFWIVSIICALMTLGTLKLR